MTTRRFGLLAVLLLSTTACHTYTAVDTPALGATVRVHVPIDNALSRPNQAPQTASIEGIVLAVGDTLALATKRRQEYGAYREIIQSDTLRLAADRPVLLEVREFSPQKSILLGAVLSVGATFAAIAALNAGRDGGNPPDPGPGPPAPALVVSGSLISTIVGFFGR